MNRNMLFAIAFLSFCFCLVGVMPSFTAGQGTEDEHALKWEYKVISSFDVARETKITDTGIAGVFLNSEQFEEWLNSTYGKNGWEMCGVSTHGVVFKRVLKTVK